MPMIILDTNVVSELMRDSPQLEVIEWADDHLASELFITAITEAEIRAGIAFLPDGRRRRDLAAAAEHAFNVLFYERILAFNSESTRVYAMIAASRRARGRPISHADCQIAAIARSHGAQIATRNVNDFTDCGIEIVNPWLV